MIKRLGPFYFKPDQKDGLLQTIEKMYEQAHRERRQVLATYNDIVILVHDRDSRTIEQIMARYQRAKARRRLEEDIAEWPIEGFECVNWSHVECMLAESKKAGEAEWRLQGLVTVRYASKWARLMDLEIQKGKSVEDMALQTFFEVNTPILCNGYVYLGAIDLLHRVWAHGAELMQWHHRTERTETDEKYDGWLLESDADEMRITIPKAIKSRWEPR